MNSIPKVFRKLKELDLEKQSFFRLSIEQRLIKKAELVSLNTELDETWEECRAVYILMNTEDRKQVKSSMSSQYNLKLCKIDVKNPPLSNQNVIEQPNSNYLNEDEIIRNINSVIDEKVDLKLKSEKNESEQNVKSKKILNELEPSNSSNYKDHKINKVLIDEIRLIQFYIGRSHWAKKYNEALIKKRMFWKNFIPNKIEKTIIGIDENDINACKRARDEFADRILEIHLKKVSKDEDKIREEIINILNAKNELLQIINKIYYDGQLYFQYKSKNRLVHKLIKWNFERKLNEQKQNFINILKNQNESDFKETTTKSNKKYIGEINPTNRLLNGYGILGDIKEEFYIGQFRDGLKSGIGLEFKLDKSDYFGESYYFGEFKKGRRNGIAESHSLPSRYYSDAADSLFRKTPSPNVLKRSKTCWGKFNNEAELDIDGFVCNNYESDEYNWNFIPFSLDNKEADYSKLLKRIKIDTLTICSMGWEPSLGFGNELSEIKEEFSQDEQTILFNTSKHDYEKINDPGLKSKTTKKNNPLENDPMIESLKNLPKFDVMLDSFKENHKTNFKILETNNKELNDLIRLVILDDKISDVEKKFLAEKTKELNLPEGLNQLAESYLETNNPFMDHIFKIIFYDGIISENELSFIHEKTSELLLDEYMVNQRFWDYAIHFHLNDLIANNEFKKWIVTWYIYKNNVYPDFTEFTNTSEVFDIYQDINFNKLIREEREQIEIECCEALNIELDFNKINEKVFKSMFDVMDLTKISELHKDTLCWIAQHKNQELKLSEFEGGKIFRNGKSFLLTRAKGIYKPEGSDYSLSIKVLMNSKFDDKLNENEDGSWNIKYHKEDDTEWTNEGLLKCMENKVPVGLFYQTKERSPSTYKIYGLGIINHFDGEYFYINSIKEDDELKFNWNPLDKILNKENMGQLSKIEKEIIELYKDEAFLAMQKFKKFYKSKIKKATQSEIYNAFEQLINQS